MDNKKDPRTKGKHKKDSPKEKPVITVYTWEEWQSKRK